MKKIISLILVVFLLSASVAVCAAPYSQTNGTSATYSLSVSDPVYYVGTQSVASPEAAAGNTVKTSVTVTNYGTAPNLSATLVVAVKDLNGQVCHIAMDEAFVSNGTPKTLSAEVLFPSATGYTYSYYVWDNLDNMNSLGNEAPKTPGNFKVKSVSNSSVTLSWDAAADDVGIDHYVVYDGDGNELDTVSGATEYTAYGFDEKATSTYYVVAVDGGGLTSEPTEKVSATTEKVYNVKIADLDSTWFEDGIPYDSAGYTFADGNIHVLGLPTTYTNVVFFNTPDEFNALIEAEKNLENSAKSSNIYSLGTFFGEKAFAQYNLTGSAYGFTLKIPDTSALVCTTPENRTLVVRYFDNSTDPVNIRYRKTDKDTWATISFNRTGTNQWQTKTLLLENAVLYYSGKGQHICFDISKDLAPVYVSEIGILKSDYVPKYETLNAPGNLRATDVSATSVDLAWDAVTTERTDILGYNIYDGEGNLVGTTDATYYTVDGLTTGTLYSFTVTAFGEDDNESAHSTSLSVTPESFPAPTGLVAGSITTSSVTLTWTAVSDVEGYNVYYANGDFIGTSLTASYEVENLDEDSEYSFYVTAYGNGEESNPSSVATAKTENIAYVNISDLPSAWFATGIPCANEDFDPQDGIYVRALPGSYTQNQQVPFKTPTEFTSFVADSANVNATNIYSLGEFFGKKAYASYNMSNGGYGLTLKAPQTSVVYTPDGVEDRTMIVTYYDNGTDPFYVRYRTTGNAWLVVEWNRENTNQWVTREVTLEDAYLNNSASQQIIFTPDKISVSQNINVGYDPVYISSVGIAKNYKAKTN